MKKVFAVIASGFLVLASGAFASGSSGEKPLQGPHGNEGQHLAKGHDKEPHEEGKHKAKGHDKEHGGEQRRDQGPPAASSAARQ